MSSSEINNVRGFIALTIICSLFAMACDREPRVLARNESNEAMTIEERYGLSGVYSDRITAGNLPTRATIVPVTLADGRQAQLVIPQSRATEHRVYLRENGELIPVVLQNPGVSRDEFINSQPQIVERRVVDEPRRTAVAPKKKRSLEKELLIVGGSAAGGAAIGALAGGGKGAAIGGLSGGIAGLVYDLATRNK